MVDNKGVRYILPETLPEAYLTLFINICKQHTREEDIQDLVTWISLISIREMSPRTHLLGMSTKRTKDRLTHGRSIAEGSQRSSILGRSRRGSTHGNLRPSTSLGSITLAKPESHDANQSKISESYGNVSQRPSRGNVSPRPSHGNVSPSASRHQNHGRFHVSWANS